MSRERCHSLDRVQHREQRDPFTPNEVCVPERPPNTSFRHYGEANNNRSSEYLSDNSNKFLEDLEDPRFSDLPPESSFDEVRCIMATPTHAAHPATSTTAEKLDELRSKISEVIQLDFPKGVATHAGSYDVDPQNSIKQVDDIRKRIAAVVAGNAAEPQFYPYRIPPLPKDPHVIPPPPENPKDVADLIRRAKAIARLKHPKGEQVSKSLRAQKKLTKKAPASPKPKLVSTTAKQIPKLKKNGIHKQRPPDYVLEDWTDTVLRTRKPSGPIASKTVRPRPPLRQITPPRPKTLTFEDILERMSAIRSRTDEAKLMLGEKKSDIFSPRPQEESEELDEFEVLEELYGAANSDQCAPTQQSISNLRNRINVLQQQLLQSPVPMEPMAQEELDEFAALEQQFGGITSVERPAPEYFATDLKDRINVLKGSLLPSPTRAQSLAYELPTILRNDYLQQSGDVMAAAAAKIGSMQSIQVYPSSQDVSKPKAGTKRILPAAIPQTCSEKFNGAKLQDMDVLELDPTETQEFEFFAKALADAGFEIENDVCLDEITMPDFDEDTSLDEFDIANITSPDLCDLSISNCDLVLEPDTKNDHVVKEALSEQPGLLTSVINAIVDRLKTIFSTPKSGDDQNVEQKTKLELDSSLPNMFETTPPTGSNVLKSPRTQSLLEEPASKKYAAPRSPIVIPPHYKDAKDYKAMLEKTRAIHTKQIEESTTAKDSSSSLPKVASPQNKRVPMQKKRKAEKPTKYCPPGEYSPSYVKAVARARNLRGLQNLSAALNPERAAKLAKQKAARQAKLAAIEALPPVERMRAKMRNMRRTTSGLPMPSIEALATLEAIRENLPKSVMNSHRTTGRIDRRIKPSERPFLLDFVRLSPQTEKSHKNKNREEFSIMSPIPEESELKVDLIQFSPLKPHEVRMRLCYLRDQAAKNAIDILRAVEDKQAEIETSPILPIQLSPILLHSTSSSKTQKTGKEKIITKLCTHRDPDIAAEVAEISAIESGEVNTSIGQVATETDKHGILAYNTQNGTGLSEDNLADIEPPDFLDTSDVTPPRTHYILTTNEIINRIRAKIEENRNFASSNVQHSFSPEMIAFPQDLPDEYLHDIKTPDFERTPRKVSDHLKIISPCEQDIRMYAWGEHPPVALPIRAPTSIVSPACPEREKYISPIPKTKSEQETICIPPHPGDPKDYNAMIKRAQAIQKLQKQKEITLAKQHIPETGRVLKYRRLELPPKRPQNKRLILKKRILQPSTKKIKQQRYDVECRTELPPLPEKYREAIARARLLHGLKNRTAALNPTLAAKIAKKKADEEAAKATYDALPEVEKIKIKIKKMRMHPSKKSSLPLSDPNNIVGMSQQNLGALETTSKKFSNLDTPRRSKRHGQRFLLREFSSFPKYVGTHTLVQTSKESPPSPTAQTIAPSMRKIRQVDGFQVTPIADVLPVAKYDDPIQDFRIPVEDIVLETSQLMPETPPRNTQEKFQRLKDAQEKQSIPPVYSIEDLACPDVPTVVYSPIKLISPSATVCKAHGRLYAPDFLAEENQWILNIDEAPERAIRPARQFKDLEDMPFDDLEYEIEPAFVDISFDKPLSPPPETSEIISRIKSKLEAATQRLKLPSPPMLKFPEELPDEELLDLSAPSFIQTPPKSPTKKCKSPRVYLPMAWEVARPATPITPEHLSACTPTPIKKPIPLHCQEVSEEKVDTTDASKNVHQKSEAAAKSNSRKLLRKLVKESEIIEEKQCPAAPPALSDDYRETVAQIRLLHCLKNTTPALNPKIAANHPQMMWRTKPPMDQVTDLEASKQIGDIQASTAAHIATPIAFPVEASEVLHYTPLTLPSSPQIRSQLDSVEDLDKIQEPSPLDITPSTPVEIPRPRDIIGRIRMQVEQMYRPEVPIGHLVELRTPPRMLALPTDLPEEELLNLSYPSFERTPQSPECSPVRSPNISIPQLFQLTPTSTLRPLSPVRHRIPAPQGTLVMPTHPADPEDYGTMVRRARKNKQLIKQNETDVQKPKEGEAGKLRRAAQTSRRPRIHKGLVMKKPGEECNAEPSPLPEHVEVARKLAYLKSIYERIQAEKTNEPKNFEDRPSNLEFRCSPIRFISPRIGETQTQLAETLNLAAFDNLDELEKLSEIEQPSFINISKYEITNDEYLPLTSPHTAPPPSAIINRIRQQYCHNHAIPPQERPMPTPESLEFPKALPEEKLFEQSAPSFAETPVKLPTPIMTPNISIPQYFEESPLPAMSARIFSSPITGVIDKNLNLKSPALPGVCPGIKMKTPQGQNAIPSHPKDPKDVVATIRRAQMIQKLLARKSASRSNAKARIPLLSKTTIKTVPQKGHTIELKRKENKSATTRRSAMKCSAEPPELPPEYLAAEAKARKSKHVPALLKSKSAAAAKVTPSPLSYATIMKKVAALRAKHKQVAPSTRELTYKQHLINRLQRQERKRLFNELEQLRQQQVLEFQPFKTPTPAAERLEAVKARMIAEATTSSAHPYSPVKTPEIVDLPQYQPLALSQTPPFPFLENVSITDIADVSMHQHDSDNYTLDRETTDEEGLEFELAEIANEAYDFGENVDVAEVHTAKDAFDIAERIQMLRQQLLKSSDKIDADLSQEYNLKKRIEFLKNQLLCTPTQDECPTEDTSKAVCDA